MALVVKTSLTNAGDITDVDLILGLGRSPGVGNGNPLQYFLPGEFHGQGSLVSFSPWGCKELDTIEQLTHST